MPKILAKRVLRCASCSKNKIRDDSSTNMGLGRCRNGRGPAAAPLPYARQVVPVGALSWVLWLEHSRNPYSPREYAPGGRPEIGKGTRTPTDEHGRRRQMPYFWSMPVRVRPCPSTNYGFVGAPPNLADTRFGSSPNRRPGPWIDIIVTEIP